MLPLKYPIFSGQSNPIAKDCMFDIVDTASVIEEHWSSANFLRNLSPLTTLKDASDIMSRQRHGHWS